MEIVSLDPPHISAYALLLVPCCAVCGNMFANIKNGQSPCYKVAFRPTCGQLFWSSLGFEAAASPKRPIFIK